MSKKIDVHVSVTAEYRCDAVIQMTPEEYDELKGRLDQSLGETVVGYREEDIAYELLDMCGGVKAGYFADIEVEQFASAAELASDSAEAFDDEDDEQ